MHFSFRQLQAFVTVADIGSFTRAADVLHMSPSAVSQLLQELEAALGYKLLERSTRKVALSAAGRTFMPAAQAVLRQMDLARATARDIRYQTTGLVRVAAPLVVASVMLPRLIAAFAQLRPKVTVRVLDCPVDALVEKVANREADIAIGPDRPVVSGVERLLLYPSPWVCWCAPTHAFARRHVLRWADLSQANLVVAGRDHEIHLAALMRNLPDPCRVWPQQVVDNISTALGLAAAGLCCTISPAYVRALALPLGLTMLPLQEPVLQREMSLFRSADGSLSPAATGFAEFVQHQLRTVPQEAGVSQEAPSNTDWP